MYVSFSFYDPVDKMQTIIILLLSALTVLAIPLNPNSIDEDLSVVGLNDTNTTAQDLYVIRAVVYEIGILTNVDENSTSTNETLTNEQVDLTFFNPDKNGSIIDLGNIPLPVQTNISGHIITGIAPIDLGSITASDFNSLNISDGILSNLPISDNLMHLAPSILIFNTSDSSTEDETNHTLDSNFVFTIPPLLQLNTLIEPLPLTVTNQTFFSSKIS